MHFIAFRFRWLPALLCLWGLTPRAVGVGAAATAPGAVPPAVGAAQPTPRVLSPCGLPGFAQQALHRINTHRAQGAHCGAAGRFGATAALVWHDALAQAAEGHARDMAAREEVSHASGDGHGLGHRLSATGYLWRTAAENIAAGPRSVQAVVDAWMASDGHCANLMQPAVVHLGLACVAGDAHSRYPTYWSLTVAAPR